MLGSQETNLQLCSWKTKHMHVASFLFLSTYVHTYICMCLHTAADFRNPTPQNLRELRIQKWNISNSTREKLEAMYSPVSIRINPFRFLTSHLVTWQPHKYFSELELATGPISPFLICPELLDFVSIYHLRSRWRSDFEDIFMCEPWASGQQSGGCLKSSSR